ncbi:MAG: site-specific DNA-methyltransferase [Brevinema sp.]
MSNVSYKQYFEYIILDFPKKDMVLYEDFHKAETCYIEQYHSLQIELLLSPKNLIDWTLYTPQGVSPISNLQRHSNFLFQGNNLLVLHTIKSFFKNSVKLIYIDPPYNTGNTFTYKDKFSRAMWLLFMKNRLEIAREFLQQDGIFVVQCDENEHAYLKILLDELFGEELFLGAITVLTNPSGRDYRSLARTHEYLLIYGNSIQAELYPLVLDKDFPFNDQLGGFELRGLRNGNIRFHQGNRPNLYYPFYVNPKKKDQYGHHIVSLTSKKSWIEIYPKESQGVHTVWRWGKDKVLQNITNSPQSSNLVARASKNSYLIFEKYRKNTRLARTIWDDKEFYTSKGTKQIKKLFQDSVFDYPKPELLIAKIIDIATKKGDRVMDFFLGSGTTVAVAHKAGRSWIGVEQMDYINTVTIPRLQKVIQGQDQGGASSHYFWNGGGDFIFSGLEPREEFPYYKKLEIDNILHQLGCDIE